MASVLVVRAFVRLRRGGEGGAYDEIVLEPREIEERLCRALETAPADVAAGYLFGSVARGTPRKSSDVDVAILFAHDPPATLDSPVFEIAGDLEQETGIPTQVVALNSAPPDLVHRVLRDGKVLLDRDRAARIRFEVKARNEFFDMQPIVARYRRPPVAPPTMTDPDLIRKKLAHIETCVRDVRTLARPERIRTDVREERFIEHTLQIAIQAALDVASHLVSDERLGEPSSNRELFQRLARVGIVEAPLARRLDKMAAFRNVLVHGYQDVDLKIVEDVVENRLEDLLAFVDAIRARLGTS